MSEEPIEVTFLVIETLDSLGIRYLIAGSLASAIYGEPRATRDADILADIRQEHVERICQMLEPDFNVSENAIRNALKHRTSFNAIHFESLFKVYIFVPKNRPFDEQEFNRRSLHIVASSPDRRAYVASAEDVILAKLDWYRQGSEISEQQWRDVLGIFKTNGNRLDIKYMRRTATELGVLNLLERLISATP